MSAARESLAYVAHPGSDHLLVLLSGRRMGYRVDRFSFSKATRRLAVNRLYLRDNFGLWYHRGLEGRTETLVDTAAFLTGFAAERGCSRITMLGVSAGGYAALILGHLTRAAAVVAIAPRTRLHPDSERHADRNREGVLGSLRKLAVCPGAEAALFDLAPYFADNPVAVGRVAIHYDPAHSLDRFHAENLASIPGIALTQHPGTGHTLARVLVEDPLFLRDLLTGG
ncbi:MAG: alpha/beta hydrolase [Pseudomonadota bacterium]